ncbi:patatin-like phospholipase family protein [Chromobacterium violaceum]|uniref:patatin-like phospholipase family protein n=1 Tax=Chromobacterium violaceum TaxID=536 RepID=UPI001B326372|nr:patatin-like phospholipase family protein [Chromobacterium violaceum]MBP4048537.1 patatin-like phospholipase family protein [Chromobacterium violaceum]MCD0491131.1 patatin-like phospholipase family protein [Chromobacterium violaceum]
MFRRVEGELSLSLALQGGGAHGAFTWGVLDALLEAGCYRFDGLSGTSAGAMNAVAVAHGLCQGGPEAARETLAAFWLRVGESLPGEMARPSPFSMDSTVSPSLKMALKLSQWFSPYQLNPLDYNPLRDIIVSLFDFERIRQASPVQLFVAATHANSGQLKLFRNDDLCADALLASACLPSLQQAVMIDGEPYWDGGFAANPAIFPLFKFCRSDDILLVLLSPMAHGETPRTAEEIQRRAMLLGFNSAFLREMRLFALLREMADAPAYLRGRLERHLLATRFHLIEAHDLLSELDASSRALTHGPFLAWLRDEGRKAAQSWMAEHGGKVGRSASVDINRLFLKA